jgi:4-amino-4-deoxy-L-arabinose transferase-like glycosyltransferase
MMIADKEALGSTTKLYRIPRQLSLPLIGLALLVVAGLWLRVWGQKNGLPYVIPADEPVIVDAGTRILKTGDFDPQMYYYPSLYVYLQTFVYLLAFIWGAFSGLYSGLDSLPDKTYAITTAPQIYVWGRWLTAIIGALGIALVYFMVVKIWQDKRVALLAAGFLTVSALAVENSHYITVDIPLATFALVALYPAWRVLEYGTRRDYIWLGVAAGLTIGSKWTGVSVVSLILVAHLLYLSRQTATELFRRFFSANLFLSLAVTGLTVLATTPFLLTRIRGFLDAFGLNLAKYRLAETDYSSDFPWQGNLQVLWDDSGMLLVLGIAGLIWAIIGRERRNLLLITFPLVYFVSLNGSRLIYKRNLLPLTYYLVILAALFMWWAIDKLAKIGWKNKVLPLAAMPVIGAAVVSVVMWSPLNNIFYGNQFNDQPFSYERAEAWLKQEVGMGGLKLVEMRPQQWGDYPNTFAVFGDEDKGANDFPLGYYRERGIGYLAINLDRVASRTPRNSGSYPELLQPELIAERIETKKIGKPGPPFVLIKTGVSPETFKPEHRLNTDFSGKLRLLGFNAGKAKVPNEVYLPPPGEIKAQFPTFKPGDIIGLTVYWQVLEPLNADYVVFIHLVPLDKPDIQAANRDTPPFQGVYPTSKWRTGELVVDSPNLILPDGLAPGDYILRLGLYLSDGKFTPLPLSDGKPFVKLGQIKISK